MPKEKSNLSVKDIKEITPLADVYEFKKWNKYLVIINRPSIIGTEQWRTEEIAKHIARILAAKGITCALLVNVDKDVKFLEIS